VTSLRYVRPARIVPQERSAGTARQIPAADTSVWEVFLRKEVAHPGATSEPIYDRAELDTLLGPVHTGLQAGDELRFSGRLANDGRSILRNISIENSCGDPALTRDVLGPGERMVFLDTRRTVTASDVELGVMGVTFSWRAELLEPDGQVSAVGGDITERYSTDTGLPL